MNACRATAAALLLSLGAVVPALGAEGDPTAAAAGVAAPQPAHPAPAAVPGPAAPVVIDRVADEDLMGILRGEGYAPTFEKPGVIRARIESMSVIFFVAADGRSLQAFCGFRSTTASLETVNAWNRAHRYSRAYLDRDGDPVVELDLDLAGGVTRERVLDFVRTVRVSVLAFVKAVSGANP